MVPSDLAPCGPRLAGALRLLSVLDGKSIRSKPGALPESTGYRRRLRR
jgi:hypothetical protein